MNSVWTISLTATARKALKKLPRADAAKINSYLTERIATRENPRELGHALVGPLKGYWRYRVEDYRLVVSIKDQELMILVIMIGDRKEVYR